jgi:POTRA domain, FtsQ-type
MRASKSTKRSRADEVRARRNAEKPRANVTSPRPVRQTSPTIQRSHVAPVRPVTSRTNIPGVPTRKHYQDNQTKHTYVSLPSLGAELRLPALPRVQVGWRLLSGLIVAVMAGILLVMWNQPMFQIDLVNLTGAKRLTSNDIISVLHVKGMRVIEANPNQMAADLQKSFPDLSQVQVHVSLPAGLHISVSERQPVIAWQEDKQTQWISQDGIAFPPRGDPGVTLVKVQAQGNLPANTVQNDAGKGTTAADKTSTPAPFLSPALLNAILTLAPQVPAKTAIIYDPDYGLGWNDPAGWQVFFGDQTGDMAAKLAQYQAIVAQLKKENIHPKLISVAFPTAPFFRLE